MTYTTLISSTAGILLIVFMFERTLNKSSKRNTMWMIPAAISILFLMYSLQTIVAEGLFGFWETHISSLWATQIWVDLLIAIGIGWSFMVPRAKAVGMHTIAWVVVILLTGCIGFLAMVSRMLYLEQKTSVADAVVQ